MVFYGDVGMDIIVLKIQEDHTLKFYYKSEILFFQALTYTSDLGFNIAPPT